VEAGVIGIIVVPEQGVGIGVSIEIMVKQRVLVPWIVEM
jgi:hypothetical protein